MSSTDKTDKTTSKSLIILLERVTRSQTLKHKGKNLYSDTETARDTYTPLQKVSDHPKS